MPDPSLTPTIVERLLDWAWATVAGVYIWAQRLQARLQKLETRQEDAKAASEKSAENGERLARVETSLGEFKENVANTMTRLEDKIDRVLER